MPPPSNLQMPPPPPPSNRPHHHGQHRHHHQHDRSRQGDRHRQSNNFHNNSNRYTLKQPPSQRGNQGDHQRYNQSAGYGSHRPNHRNHGHSLEMGGQRKSAPPVNSNGGGSNPSNRQRFHGGNKNHQNDSRKRPPPSRAEDDFPTPTRHNGAGDSRNQHKRTRIKETAVQKTSAGSKSNNNNVIDLTLDDSDYVKRESVSSDNNERRNETKETHIIFSIDFSSSMKTSDVLKRNSKGKRVKITR